MATPWLRRALPCVSRRSLAVAYFAAAFGIALVLMVPSAVAVVDRCGGSLAHCTNVKSVALQHTSQYNTTTFNVPTTMQAYLPEGVGSQANTTTAVESASRPVVADGLIWIVGSTFGAPAVGNVSTMGNSLDLASMDAFVWCVNETSLATLYVIQFNSQLNGTDAFSAAAASAHNSNNTLPYFYFGGSTTSDFDGVSGVNRHKGGYDGVVGALVKTTGAVVWVHQLGSQQDDEVVSLVIEDPTATRPDGVLWAVGRTGGSLFTPNDYRVRMGWVAGLHPTQGTVLYKHQFGADGGRTDVKINDGLALADHGLVVVVGMTFGPVNGQGATSNNNGDSLALALHVRDGVMFNVKWTIVTSNLKMADSFVGVSSVSSTEVLWEGTFQHQILNPFFYPRGMFEPWFAATGTIDVNTGLMTRSIVRGYSADGRMFSRDAAYNPGHRELVNSGDTTDDGVYLLAATQNDLATIIERSTEFPGSLMPSALRDYTVGVLYRVDFTSLADKWFMQFNSLPVTGAFVDPKGIQVVNGKLLEIGTLRTASRAQPGTYVRQHTLCPPGSVSRAITRTGGYNCLKCAPGYHQPMWDHTGSCVACPAGTYSTEGSGECVRCPPGQFQNATAQASCYECERGYFQTEYGQTSCLPCVGGGYANSTGLAGCHRCPPGTATNATASVSEAACFHCPEGAYSAQPGMSTCLPCPAGSYTNRTGTVTCDLCPAGTANANINQTTINSCTRCSPGEYADTDGLSACKACAPGSVTTIHSQTACVPCAMGTHQPSSNMTSCEICPAGSVAPNNATAKCAACPAGMYAKEDKLQCQSCNADTYTDRAGMSECIVCPFGSKSAPGSSHASACMCPPNHFGSPELGYVCRLCPPNADCSSRGIDPGAAPGYFIESTTNIISRRNETFQRGGKLPTRIFSVGSSSANEDPFVMLSESDVYEFEQSSYSCSPASACPGGVETCAQGYVGHSCESCDDEYFRSASGDCMSCTQAMPLWANLVILVIAFILATAILVALTMILCVNDARMVVNTREMVDRAEPAIKLNVRQDESMDGENCGVEYGDDNDRDSELVIGDTSDRAPGEDDSGDVGASRPTLNQSHALDAYKTSAKPYVHSLRRDVTYFEDLTIVTAINSNRIFAAPARLVRLVQISAVIFQLKISWPESVDVLQTAFSYIQPNIDILSGVQCSTDIMTYSGKVVVRLALPLILFAFFAIVMLCLRGVALVMMRAGTRKESKSGGKTNHSGVLHCTPEGLFFMSNHMERVLLVFTSTFYVFMHTAVMDHFSCFERANDRYFLTTMSDVECFVSGGVWMELLPAVIICFLLYSISIPGAFIIILVYTRKKRNLVHIVQRYGFLWAAYRDGAYLFEVHVYIFKFLLVLGLPLVTVTVLDQLFYLIVLLFWFIFETLKRRPYSHWEDNLCETVILFAALFTCVLGVLLQAEDDDALSNTGLTLLRVVVVSLYAAALMIAAAIFIRNFFKLPMVTRPINRVLRLCGLKREKVAAKAAPYDIDDTDIHAVDVEAEHYGNESDVVSEAGSTAGLRAASHQPASLIVQHWKKSAGQSDPKPRAPSEPSSLGGYYGNKPDLDSGSEVASQDSSLQGSRLGRRLAKLKPHSRGGSSFKHEAAVRGIARGLGVLAPGTPVLRSPNTSHSLSDPEEAYLTGLSSLNEEELKRAYPPEDERRPSSMGLLEADSNR